MIQMTLRFLAKGERGGLDPAKIAHVNDGTVTVFCLEGGMISGKPSVSFALEMPEGGTVVFETSARLYVQTARMIEARYPDLLA